jgi:predicted nucleotidyltransferase
MQEELSRLFDRTVDLHTPASLSRHFRSQVLAEAEDQYVAA